MPIFIYKAKKENASTVTGEVFARDAEEAVELVARLGFLPVSVHEKGASSSIVPFKSRRINQKSVHVFTRQLLRLLKSGVPLLRSLEILARQTRDAAFVAVIEEVVSNLRNGRSFSSCLKDYPHVFSDVFVTLVTAGEESGKLKDLLGSLVAYQSKQEEISSKIRGALVYPALMLFVGFGTVFFILSFVMPKLSILFAGMSTALPWPTLFVMRLSKLVQYLWPVFFIFVFIGAVFSRVLSQTPLWQRKINDFFTATPVIKAFVIKTDLERFTRTMGLLMESGVPILRALEISVPTLNCDFLREELSQCHSRVEQGASFGDCIRDSLLIPDMLTQLVAVGEESGELPSALKDIADGLEQEINETTRAATTLLEPLLILIVGLVVGFIVFAMLMPIFQMDMFAS